MTDQQLLAALAQHEQALVIVNTRSHARDLYVAASNLDGAAHLSALMCPAHRTIKLDAYKQRLLAGEPLRLIATAVIEAGVDVDFPRVWRAMAGLASIAQAAGRCNREGKRDIQQSVATVFEPAHVKPPSYLADDIAACRFAAHHHTDLLSPEAVEDYFSDLYRKKLQKRQQRGLDRRQIMGRLEQQRTQFLFPFSDVARDFTLIDDYMAPLLIPYDEAAGQLIRELLTSETPALQLRRLQRYIIQIPETKHADLVTTGDIQPVADDTDIDLWALTNMNRYRDDVGLDA
jgi:CRISPR-associated endonuclease/helicase Cas3